MSSPENVEIRKATFADTEAIVALWLEMMREHEEFDPRVRLSETAEEAYLHYARYYIGRSDSAVFVAETDGEVIAFVLAYRARNLPMFHPAEYGFISDLAVTRPWRRRGIGRALLETLKRWFLERGIEHVQLQVYDRNEAGRNFWREVGFEDFVHGLWLSL